MTSFLHAGIGLGVAAARVGDHDDSGQPSAAAGAGIEMHTMPHAVVVTVRGDVDLDLAEPLRTVLAEAVAGRGRVVLDFAQVGVIDSVGLEVLVRAHRDARRRGGEICLVAASRFIITVLHTMRLDAIFPLFDNCQQALDWLAAPSSWR